MTNKHLVLALVLLLAGLAVIANSAGVCPFSAEGVSCQAGSSDSEKCTGDHANCSANCTGTHCALNNSSQSNCTTAESCPVEKE
ncbi:MAG TPA: hypothetical protein PKK11_03970 [Methanothrix sp.]|nr:hypothetical protein [Methanothrix sp.]HPT19835.1 hypothetical protein [Methanothrix sp.]